MGTRRLPIRKSREVLHLKWVLGQTHRQAAKAVGVGASSVANILARATANALDWAIVACLDDRELEQRLYRPQGIRRWPRPQLDIMAIDAQLEQPEATLRSLYQRYINIHPDGYCYSTFCQHYRRGRQGSHRSRARYKARFISEAAGSAGAAEKMVR